MSCRVAAQHGVSERSESAGSLRPPFEQESGERRDRARQPGRCRPETPSTGARDKDGQQQVRNEDASVDRAEDLYSKLPCFGEVLEVHTYEQSCPGNGLSRCDEAEEVDQASRGHFADLTGTVRVVVQQPTLRGPGEPSGEREHSQSVEHFVRASYSCYPWRSLVRPFSTEPRARRANGVPVASRPVPGQ